MKHICFEGSLLFSKQFYSFFTRMSNKTDVGLTSPDRYYRGSPSSNLVLAICEFQLFIPF